MQNAVVSALEQGYHLAGCPGRRRTARGTIANPKIDFFDQRGCSIKLSPAQILEQATRDELAACVQLLAQSVVLHRAKFGIVTLHKSTEELLSDAGDVDQSGLFTQGKAVLEEALEIVRTLAAAPLSGMEIRGQGSGSESRSQLRISSAVPIRVLCPGNPNPVDATLENISWGGAAFVLDQQIDPDQSLRIMLPRPQGGSISIEARVLRTWQHPDGKRCGVSVRFSSLSTRDEVKLEGILEQLAKSTEEDGQRMHARLAQRLDIEFNGIQELQSTLDDISAGGLGITVPDPLPIGQSLQTVISTTDGSCMLKLRARVVHQKAIKSRTTEFYRVGLKFEHPTDELRKRVQDMLGKIAGTRIPQNN